MLAVVLPLALPAMAQDAGTVVVEEESEPGGVYEGDIEWYVSMQDRLNSAEHRLVSDEQRSAKIVLC